MVLAENWVQISRSRASILPPAVLDAIPVRVRRGRERHTRLAHMVMGKREGMLRLDVSLAVWASQLPAFWRCRVISVSGARLGEEVGV
jgi:hypothetical protein